MKALTHVQFEKRVKARYPELRVTGHYRSTRRPVQAYCTKIDELGNEHGSFTIKSPSLFLHGKYSRNGCKKCANESRSKAKTQYHFNPSYFETPTLESCYWAGFIAADGCIHDKRHWSIKLSFKDREHLMKLSRCIGYNGPLYEQTRKSNLNGKTYTSSSLIISNSTKLIHDLQTNFRIGPNKSITYTHPKGLTNEQALAFIKGYIDGDGHVKNTTKRIRIGAVGTLETLSWIQEHFDRISPSASLNGLTAKPRKIKGCNGYYYEVAHNRAERIITILKELDTPELSRKWA